jgi:peptidoglycan/xylan/chitin deacetylase (PgdA/CDA1 family)
MRLCAISVDLDEIPNYYAIHGLDPAASSGRGLSAVYDVAVGRLLDLAEEERVPLTLFAIGADLVRTENAETLRGAHDRGHEIANHTLDHRYDLTRLGREEIAHQIEGGITAIARAVGEPPVGFRAPGYTITDEVFDLLQEMGVKYDSSVFPCPAYWALKATAIGVYKARGRESRSIVDTPSVLRAPTRPYFVGKPYWKRGTGLLELPVQVTPKLRLQFIGTTVTMAGPTGARRLAEMCVGEPLVNLELHGIDVLDERDGLDELAPHQIDVRIARERKLAAIRAVITVMRDNGYAFTTLREAATRFV